MSHTQTADTVIIGAGPAGLTAGLELLRAGKRDVLVLEATDDIGGLSRTVNYKGNRIDIGGHRFFSKSDWVMNWWREMLPVAMPPGAMAEKRVPRRPTRARRACWAPPTSMPPRPTRP